MALTPNDILNKEFSTKFRGYDADQVNDYLDIIVAEFERLRQENNNLSQELAAASEKNAYFAQLQDSLNSSIVVAQEAAERLKQNSRKEAELILYEAEREADRIISQASETAKGIVTESDALRRSSKSYRAKLEQAIRQQLELVTSDKYHELFDEELEERFNPDHFQEASQRASDRMEQLNNAEEEDFQEVERVAQRHFHQDHEATYFDTQEIDENLDMTRVHNYDVSKQLQEEYSQQNPDASEDVLGQTIRIDLTNKD